MSKNKGKEEGEAGRGRGARVGDLLSSLYEYISNVSYHQLNIFDYKLNYGLVCIVLP